MRNEVKDVLKFVIQLIALAIVALSATYFFNLQIMKNVLGHEKDLTLYGSCGNVMYAYINVGNQIVETFYSTQGEVLRQKTKSI